MAATYENTDAFAGASFTHADFSGVTFRDCDLSRLKVADAWLRDVYLSGEISHVVVNDVDVTAYVAAELDRQHPERVQLRSIKTPADYRAMWNTIERIWSETVARASLLPESALREQVDDEWSFVETLRHLLFATEAWAFRTVLDEPSPFHRWSLPQPGYAPEKAAALSIDVAADPSLAEVLAVRADEFTVLRGIMEGLTETELGRLCERPPAPGYPDEERSVGKCLRVVLHEECEHHRYAVRDLAVLEAQNHA